MLKVALWQRNKALSQRYLDKPALLLHKGHHESAEIQDLTGGENRTTYGVALRWQAVGCRAGDIVSERLSEELSSKGVLEGGLDCVD